MEIGSASLGDLEEILALQKLAYRREAEIYADFSIQPLTQTIEQTREESSNHTFLKAKVESRIVGSVRAREEGGACFVGKLIAHPEFWGRGVGTALMREIEAVFSGVSRFELFTGHWSERNLELYEKLGYRRFDTKKVDDSLTLVFMEKVPG